MQPRFQTMLCASVACLTAAPFAVHAQDRVQHFAIPAEPAAAALNDWAKQADVQIVFPYAATEARQTPAVHGDFPPRVALQMLIKNLGLVVTSDQGGTITLGVSQPKVSDGGDSDTLAEIVVTAEKRSAAIEVVPVSVSVLDATAMEQRHITQLADYLGSVPGLTANISDQGQVGLTIRGITTGQGGGNPTVGVTVDDVPVGASAGLAAGFVPELDPTVLNTIEVLRGPQGTLYGASSMGGLLRYVTAAPELTRTRASFETDGFRVAHGDTGFALRGAVTTPVVTDRLGITATAFYRRDPGYVSGVATGAADANSAVNYGGRLSALWQITDRASWQVAALYQRTNGHGSSTIDVDDSLRAINGYSNSFIPGAGPYRREFQLYTSDLKIDLGWGTLTSVTGYQVARHNETVDFTPILGELASAVTGQDDVGALTFASAHSRKFSEELRLEASPTKRLSLLGGVFYTREKSSIAADIVASDLTTGAVVLDVLPDNVPVDNYREYAVFGDATYQVSDTVDVKFGARYAKNEQKYHEIVTGPLFPTPSDVRASSKGDAATYLLTPRWRISPHTMAYVRIASGYRPGGPNPGAQIGFPDTFQSDSLTSYETGLKGSLFGNRLKFSTDIYYIDWKRIQLQATDPATQFIFFVNGGKAKSQGAEVEVTAAPVEGLTITATAGYSDARLRKDLSEGLVGSDGDRLPYSPRWTYSLDVQKTFALSDGVSAFIGGDIRHVGGRPSDFSSSIDVKRIELPAYTLLDLRAGLDINNVSISVFARNVTDEFAVLSARPVLSFADTGVNHATVQAPRTVGVSISYRY